MTSYEQLEVWQKAVNLVIEMYKATSCFPETEKFGLTAQIRRAVTSIPANIAEGWGRGSTNEYIHFLQIARGSVMELETHSIIAGKLGYISQEQLTALRAGIQEIGKMLNGLRQSLRSKSHRQLPSS